MNEDLLLRIKTRLKLDHYSMNDEWLRDCVEFLMDKHQNASPDEILQFVKVQWELSNLREINNENGCLPRNLSQQLFITLPDKYILQVEQIYDIATSKYKQLEQIRNSHISEAEISEEDNIDKHEPVKKRMMQLRLTDGLEDILGIEYSYIPQLNSEVIVQLQNVLLPKDMLLPGYKVMIVGPVKCRKGVLLLEEKNFKSIGGEVDSLLITNAVENVLARALHLPENPNPYNELHTNNGKKEEPKVENNLFEDDFEVNFSDLDQIEDSHKHNTSTEDTKKTGIENANAGIKTVQHNEVNEILDDGDDCFLEMIDEIQLVERQMEQMYATAPYTTAPPEDNGIIVVNQNLPSTTADIVGKPKLPADRTNLSSTDFQLGISNKAQASLIGGKRNVPVSPSEVVIPKRSRIDKEAKGFSKALNSSESKITKFMKPLIVPENSGISSLSNQSATTTFNVPSYTLQESKLTEFTKALSTPRKTKITEFKKQLNVPEETEKFAEPQSSEPAGKLEHCEFIRTIKNRECTETTYKTVRAKVESIGKLKKKESLWSLDIVLVDGTESMEVTFSNQVLESLIGFSYREFSLKKKLKRYPEIEQEIRTSLRNAEQIIQSLDALVQLELNANKKPVVINITNLTSEQKQILNRKVENFLLQNV